VKAVTPTIPASFLSSHNLISTLLNIAGHVINLRCDLIISINGCPSALGPPPINTACGSIA
jgi:hypothetical protein